MGRKKKNIGKPIFWRKRGERLRKLWEEEKTFLDSKSIRLIHIYKIYILLTSVTQNRERIAWRKKNQRKITYTKLPT